MTRQLAEPKSTRPWRDVLAELERRHQSQAGPRWHLVQVAARERDRHAHEWITRLGFEIYCPMVRVLTTVPRRDLSRTERRIGLKLMCRKLEPLLPRYHLVRFDQAEGRWPELSEIAGVGGVACEGGRPVPIADDLIERLRSKEVEGAIPGELPASSVFHLGGVVHIADPASPWYQFSGPIERIRERTIEGVDVADRLTVTLRLFGRFTPVDFYPEQVESA
jgi:transcription antitermination factor NusG